MPDHHFFYLARCSDGSLYAGTCADLKDREKKHNDGSGSKYTRSRLPIVFVYHERHVSLSDARKREAEVKTWTKKRKEAFVCKS